MSVLIGCVGMSVPVGCVGISVPVGCVGMSVPVGCVGVSVTNVGNRLVFETTVVSEGASGGYDLERNKN